MLVPGWARLRPPQQPHNRLGGQTQRANREAGRRALAKRRRAGNSLNKPLSFRLQSQRGSRRLGFLSPRWIWGRFAKSACAADALHIRFVFEMLSALVWRITLRKCVSTHNAGVAALLFVVRLQMSTEEAETSLRGTGTAAEKTFARSLFGRPST